jgi:glycosyltransferase involved in cell wall biosynthesis
VYLSMKKVLLVANTDWYLYNFRLNLARYLREKGMEVVLVSPPGEYAAQFEAHQFRWVPWVVNRRSTLIWFELAAMYRLFLIYRSERPDLVHHFTVKPVLYGSLSAALLRIPGVIDSITGLGYLFLQDSVFVRFLRSITEVVYRLAFSHPNLAVIFENDSDRLFFLREGLVKKERCYLIQGVGVDTDYYQPVPEPDGVPVVVLPARLLWDKGVGDLVEAARILKTKLIARFALVGEPDSGNPASIDPATIQQWADEGVVEVWGWKSNMREVYAASNIVVLPSMGEGLPTALIEACACGRAIVTTDVPGCRDVVVNGVNGVLVPPGNPNALADGIALLLMDQGLRCNMGAAGRRFAEEHFSSGFIQNQIWEIYHQVLNPE